MKKPKSTVTAELRFGSVHIIFGVSVTTPGLHGEPAVLHVSRWFHLHQSWPSGVRVVTRTFGSAEAAWQWAYERGYLQEYFRRNWCAKHRVLHISGQYDVPAYERRPGYHRMVYSGTCSRAYQVPS